MTDSKKIEKSVSAGGSDGSAKPPLPPFTRSRRVGGKQVKGIRLIKRPSSDVFVPPRAPLSRLLHGATFELGSAELRAGRDTDHLHSSGDTTEAPRMQGGSTYF